VTFTAAENAGGTWPSRAPTTPRGRGPGRAGSPDEAHRRPVRVGQAFEGCALTRTELKRESAEEYDALAAFLAARLPGGDRDAAACERIALANGPGRLAVTGSRTTEAARTALTARVRRAFQPEAGVREGYDALAALLTAFLAARLPDHDRDAAARERIALTNGPGRLTVTSSRTTEAARAALTARVRRAFQR
jgi:hypothetical protein